MLDIRSIYKPSMSNLSDALLLVVAYSSQSVLDISEDAYPKGEAPKGEPPGEGPILRWETRVVLSPGGEAFHPANRKVKVSVYVKELELTPIQKERLLAMVGKRYNPNKDELTIVSERYVPILAL